MNLEVQISKTVLRSPISGVVTKQDAKVGEIAPAGVILVSVISNARYEIEANIPEADIAKIKIGDRAEVTLDAYGSDVIFPATVSKIDPAETIIDGVATYKTTLQFDTNDDRVKPGMTANTDISGQKRIGVLFIPGRAISTKDGVKTVNLVEEAVTREVIVTTGLRGSNGDVEILSGLKEGDRVKTN
jgi:RND family efflux transporter MFP subunit